MRPNPQAGALTLRDPDQVMRLARMGSAHPMRLSFLRVLLRRVQAERWRFDRPLWEVDATGVGRAVYRARGPHRTYCLVAFAHDLPDDRRSDRVIATAWDATFALFDGEPTEADLDELAANVPLQEAGRVTRKVLSISRANRSVRLFAHVVESLRTGRQPDRAEMDAVGYLMRTTAVYGAGKFGAADRADLADRPELRAPFQAEMLSVWLTRAFTVDLVEHLAGGRTRLDPAMKRRLGVGNSTGLGMAPFLTRHPALLNAWVLARETALARVRALPTASALQVAGLGQALDAAESNAGLWNSAHPLQAEKLASLRADLAAIRQHLSDWNPQAPRPWDTLWRWGECLSDEGQEALLSLVLEPHGDLVDDLAGTLDADEDAHFAIDGRMSVGALRQLIDSSYAWTRRFDFDDANQVARFWYVSEEKLEPRLGDRHHEPGQERESPLGIARAVHELERALDGATGTVAAFVMAHPEHRHTLRRVQTLAGLPYAEIHDNVLRADVLPIDILRFKLAFFGASRFDPRSDLWVRISLFQDQPYPEEISA